MPYKAFLKNILYGKPNTNVIVPNPAHQQSQQDNERIETNWANAISLLLSLVKK